MIIPKVKINFLDFWEGFDPQNNFITRSLSQFCTPIISNEPDFLFYSCFSTGFLSRYPNAVRIYVSLENTHCNFNECDYAIGTENLTYSDRYLYFPPFYMSLDKEINNRYIPNTKRKFCNFIYSNEIMGQGAIERKKFCEQLMKYKHVDCPGKVLNNMKADSLSPRTSNQRSISKIKFISNYKFTIAWENTFGDYYVTEKLSEPLIAKSIPIYWGGESQINKNSYISVTDYSNFDDLIAYIIELDNNEDLYNKILSQEPLPSNYNFDKERELSTYLENIIVKGPHQRARDSVDKSTFALLREKSIYQKLKTSFLKRLKN